MTNTGETQAIFSGCKATLSRRGLLASAGAFGAGMVWARARPAQAQSGPNKGGKLTMGVGIGQSSDSLDPALASSQVPFTFLMTMGERLVDIAPDGSLDMRLAKSVEANADATVWTFTIRSGVSFHNGQPLEPLDVLRTLERHASEQTQSGAKGILEEVNQMRVESDRLIITLDSPNADFPYLMSDFHLVVQPDGGFEAPAAGIFSGPYKLVEFEPGVYIRMERFDSYWDSSVGHFDEVEILVINDATARNAALQAGQVQIISRLEPGIIDLLSQNSNVQIATTRGRGFNCINMFCNTPPFDNADLRMALKLSINREDILEKILRGYGSVGNDIPVNSAYPLFDESIPQRTYDPDEAAFYYNRSGHSGPLVLQTADAAFPGAIDTANLFQISAAAAGIDIEVRREPDDGYWSDIWNAQPFHMSFWAGRPTQNQMYSTVYMSDSPWNDTRFSNEEFDRLIVRARGELDTEKRTEIYGEASRILRDDGGLIVPMFNQFIDAYRSDVIGGWESNPNRELMNGLAAVKCWQLG